jgi:hypothetical protein
MPGSKVRFVKRYTNHVGNVFMRFEHDGQVVDIKVREGRDGIEDTRAEAKAEAARRFGVS